MGRTLSVSLIRFISPRFGEVATLR